MAMDSAALHAHIHHALDLLHVNILSTSTPTMVIAADLILSLCLLMFEIKFALLHLRILTHLILSKLSFTALSRHLLLPKYPFGNVISDSGTK